MKLAIITEGSVKNGLGHLNRVKSFVLDVNKNKDIKIVIYAIVEKELSYVFNEISELVVYKTFKKDFSLDVINFSPDFVIFDLLEINDILFWTLKDKAFKTVSLSPIFSHLKFVDIVFSRGNINIPKGPLVYSGIEYVIIGNHVKKITNEKYQRNLNSDYFPVAVTMGGTDASNNTFIVLKELIKSKNKLLIWVLLGEGYKHSYTNLVKLIKKYPLHEIILARTNKNMWNILENVALTIVSGGITAYELAYAGLPSVNIVQKHEHKFLLQELINTNSTIYLGDFIKFKGDLLVNEIENLYNNKQLLLDMREKCHKLDIWDDSYNIINILKSQI